MEEVGFDVDREVEEIIAACGGDPRDALKALVISNRYFQQEAKEAVAATSRGYRRKAN